jgi:predicted dehydrogenase
MMTKLPTMQRRRFLRQMTAGTAGLMLGGGQLVLRAGSANERLNLGVIGVANQGQYNLNQVASENIVALCDVDAVCLAAAAEKHPKAARYTDFRRMLEEKELDAVVIATPDHTHAVAAVKALQQNLHVYCEKPLARTISEVRAITEAARRHRRVTQIGTQIHAGSNYRRVVELVQSGVIGKVTEVHVWVAASYGGMDQPVGGVPVPAGLDYDLWLGPVVWRPYSPDYVPFKWRNWWAFGGGALADFGCHFMDLPHWALGLSHPLSAVVVDGPPLHRESTPPWLVVRYGYPGRGTEPPVELTWYHGGRRPELPPGTEDFHWHSGVLFIGNKGQILSDYTRHMLLPVEQFEDFERPTRFIADSVGHHREWLDACKAGGETSCGFDYSGPLTEAALLGNVAYRTGQRVEWDWEGMQARGCPEAERYIQHEYRKGWAI